MNEPDKKVTILFLISDTQILLAMKKRGFGEGLWNGVGGKLNPDESIEEAAERECEEEISVTPIAMKKVAIVNFFYPEDGRNKGMSQQAHVFFCNEWDGEPTESDEMRPQWFDLDKIPYDSMWADDREWYPEVLAGKRIIANFNFNDNNEITSSDISETEEF